MTTDHDSMLATYGELAVKIALNLQPHQRLLIVGPIANGGASLDAAPLVRKIVESAYRAGARYVETLWGDESLQLIRYRYAPRDSFDEFSAWLPDALLRHAEAGHAVLSIYANDPDAFQNEPPELVGAVQQVVSRSVRSFRDCISRNQTNWAVIAAASPGWAQRVFPDAPVGQQMDLLWDAIRRLCRLDQPDPIGAWERHLKALAARRDYLNEKRYDALKYRAPGTDLTIGLAPGHCWVSGRSLTRSGIPFAPNLPTEEVFTMPHKDHVHGTVRSSKPLSYAGTLIENFTMRFEEGRIVQVAAERGEAILKQLIDTDPGSARLGEVALVPDNSPVAQSKVLFYNTLFDENAASHVALGSAYKFTVSGGETMSDEEFERAGGNRSATHVDFMIGSSALDIDGVLANGRTEPLMRRGDWAVGI
ncbi:MAG TPA: aminopeptidase [Vicinamibacterales bacterium]